jgi:hypothetical protein
MKTIEELKDWRTTWTKTFISANPLHATMRVEMKERNDDTYIVVEFIASKAWTNIDQFAKTTLFLAHRVTGRTEDEVVIVPVGTYATRLEKSDKVEALWKLLVVNQ